MNFADARREVVGFLMPCLLLLVGATGCSDTTDPAPQPEPRAVVELQTEPITDPFLGTIVPGVDATVSNTGDADAYYPIGCGYVVSFAVTDEQGEPILMRDPTLVPVCPPGFLILSPGEPVGARVVLTTAWNDDGTSYDTPPGQYTVRVRFRYYLSEEGEPIDLSQVMTVVLEP